MNKLQFKEKTHLSYFTPSSFLCRRGEVPLVSCVEKPVVDHPLTAESVDIQCLSRLKGSGMPTVRNNGDANEKTFQTAQRLRGQWRGR